MTNTKKHKLESLEKESPKEPKLENSEETKYSDEQYLDKLEDIPKDLIIYREEIGDYKDTKELCMRVNKYIKTILSKWENREDHDEKLLVDTKKNLFPILVKLRKNSVDDDQLTSILTIFYYLQRKEYLKSNESYMKLSIGNTAWPIGVINVGIHARSSQVKTGKSGANIMIDEITRKWITGLKRLITFTETQ